MSVAILGSLIIWLIVAVIVIAIVVYFVNWLYRRSSKEVSFVRTGLFGEKVVINSGAFVLPFIHEVTPVNMNVLRMQVVRNRDDVVTGTAGVLGKNQRKLTVTGDQTYVFHWIVV